MPWGLVVTKGRNSLSFTAGARPVPVSAMLTSPPPAAPPPPPTVSANGITMTSGAVVPNTAPVSGINQIIAGNVSGPELRDTRYRSLDRPGYNFID